MRLGSSSFSDEHNGKGKITKAKITPPRTYEKIILE